MTMRDIGHEMLGVMLKTIGFSPHIRRSLSRGLLDGLLPDQLTHDLLEKDFRISDYCERKRLIYFFDRVNTSGLDWFNESVSHYEASVAPRTERTQLKDSDYLKVEEILSFGEKRFGKVIKWDRVDVNDWLRTSREVIHIEPWITCLGMTGFVLCISSEVELFRAISPRKNQAKFFEAFIQLFRSTVPRIDTETAVSHTRSSSSSSPLLSSTSSSFSLASSSTSVPWPEENGEYIPSPTLGHPPEPFVVFKRLMVDLDPTPAHTRPAAPTIKTVSHFSLEKLLSGYTSGISCEAHLFSLRKIINIDQIEPMMEDIRRKVAIVQKRPNPSGLTSDEIYAIVAYTHENNFTHSHSQNIYNLVNEVLRRLDPSERLAPADEQEAQVLIGMWKGFFYFLDSALKKLPKSNGNIFKVLGFRTKQELEETVEKWRTGEKVRWIPFWSKSHSIEIAMDLIRYKADFRLILEINLSFGRDSSAYSFTNGERSLIMLPDSQFLVTSTPHLIRSPAPISSFYSSSLFPKQDSGHMFVKILMSETRN